MRFAENQVLSGGVVIRVVAPPYFVATKLEAYRGRGKGDPMASRDVEDILNVLDGRPSLLEELRRAPLELRASIAEGIGELLSHRDFEYVVQSTARGNADRENLIFGRLDAMAQLEA